MIQIREEYIDLLRELVNIGVGNGSNILNTMVNSHVSLQVPQIDILEYNQMKLYLKTFGKGNMDVIYLPFHGHISGSAQIILTQESALSLARQLEGINTEEQTKEFINDTLKEIGNIIINSVLGTISNTIYFHFDYSVPIFYEGNVEKLLLRKESNSNSRYLLAQTIFRIDHLNIAGNIVILFKEDAFGELVNALDVYLIENGLEVA